MTQARVAIVALAGCGGCELQLLAANPALQDIFSRVELVYWPLAQNEDAAQSAQSALAFASEQNVDLLLVEGAVVSSDQAKYLRALAERAGAVIALGSCGQNRGVWGRLTVPPQPVHAVIDVDYHVAGCPIECGELVAVLSRALMGVTQLANKGDALCGSCKLTERPCFFEQGELCLGLLTNNGCQAICPSLGKPCLGCRGLTSSANIPQATLVARAAKIDPECFQAAIGLFNAGDKAAAAASAAADEAASAAPAAPAADSAMSNALDSGTASSTEASERERASEYPEAWPCIEELAVGRGYYELPALVSRMQAQDSIAHTLAAIEAIEQAFVVSVSEPVLKLRELMLKASNLQNHIEHLFLQVLPAPLGYANIFALTQARPELAADAHLLKGLATRLLKIVAGRAIHPITPSVAGFSTQPDSAEFLSLAEDLAAAQDKAAMLVDLVHSALDGAPARMAAADDELPAALMRINQTWDALSQPAKLAAAKIGLRPVERNCVRSAEAEAVELLDAVVCSVELCRTIGANPAQSFTPALVRPKAGEGTSTVQSSAGLLRHRYRFNDQGVVVAANIGWVANVPENLR